MKNIGVINLDTLHFLNENETLKSYLIYFDNLSLSYDKELIEWRCKKLNREESFKNKMREIESLEKFGLITENNFDFENLGLNRDDYKDISILISKFAENNKNTAEEIIKFIRNLNNGILDSTNYFKIILEKESISSQLMSRMQCLLLNSNEKSNFIPIIRDNFFNIKNETNIELKVLSIVLKKFPIVKRENDLEKLLELKTDSNNNLLLLKLRNWVMEISHSNYTAKEIEQKLDYLIAEYQKNLDIHKLKYNTSQIETFTNVTLDVLENIVKLNLSKVSKTLFEIKKKDIKLMEEEQNIKGKEIAFIHKVNEIFK